jgi:PHP family Zn ribbon phosphoesterase
MDEIGVKGELCPSCGSKKIVTGVMDRILSIADRKTAKLPPHRPPYHYQIPLEFIPGLGPAKLRRLLETFGTEMTILHEASYEELDTIVGSELAGYICGARRGELAVSVGGGGVYGKVQRMEQAQK